MSTETPDVSPEVNPLLARAKMPGETFTLPSQGLFYKDGELADSVKNGEIYIYPMITLDEIAFKTPDKLFSGQAITEVLTRCCPDVRQPLKLLAKDVDFIMVALRRLTYGEEMEILFTHSCDGAKEHSYIVNMVPFITKTKRLDPTLVSTTFNITLENGQNVELNPPRFEGVLRLYQSTPAEEVDNDEELKEEVLNTLAGMIHSVDDIVDRKHIREWVEVIKADWTHKIKDAIREGSDWGPEFNTELVCKDCGKKMNVSTPINPLAFFI